MSKYQILKYYEQSLVMIEDILGSGVTNNLQLNKLGHELFGNDYIGTLCSDQMPKYIKEKQCFILNTDSSKSRNKNGHWVAFFKLNGKLWYYDSYARPAYKLSKNWASKRMYNANTKDRDQSYEESDCGSRSLAFLVVFKKFGDRAINVI